MIIVNSIKHNGFTIIEAIVSLALFAIAFSGLYLFFGMAQQANNNSEKKMYLNLMANQIIETITAETFREDSDVANPFVTPASYNADLSDCTGFTAPDVRHTWCTELDAVIGPHKGVSADEVRTVEVIQDDTNLIVNVVLVSDSGLGENNLLRTVISRKIPPPRRSTPQQMCIENHAAVIEHIKSEIENCDAGAVPNLTAQWLTNHGGSLGVVSHEQKISCPDWTLSPREVYDGSDIAGDPDRIFIEGANAKDYLFEFFTRWLNTTFKDEPDEAGLPSTKPSPYGLDFNVGHFAGNLQIRPGHVIDANWCDPTHDDYLGNISGNTLDCSYHPSKSGVADWPDGKPKLHVWSCCPDDSGGTPYNNCSVNWGSTRDPSSHGFTINLINW